MCNWDQSSLGRIKNYDTQVADHAIDAGANGIDEGLPTVGLQAHEQTCGAVGVEKNYSGPFGTKENPVIVESRTLTCMCCVCVAATAPATAPEVKEGGRGDTGQFSVHCGRMGGNGTFWPVRTNAPPAAMDAFVPPALRFLPTGRPVAVVA